MGRRANRVLGWGMLLTGPMVFGGSCAVDVYRTVRGDIGDLIRYYDDDDDHCCWDDDDWDDVEDFFDDVLDWD